MPKAAIFDLDGTLLDSVDLDAMAWHEAMVKFGHDVSFEQVRSQIGKGGDKLIPVFLSDDERSDHGKELDTWRGERFKAQYLPMVQPFAVPNVPGTRGSASPLLHRPRKTNFRSISTSQLLRRWSTHPFRLMMSTSPSRSRTSLKRS